MVSGKSGKVREFDIRVSKGDNMSGFSGKPSRKVLECCQDDRLGILENKAYVKYGG